MDYNLSFQERAKLGMEMLSKQRCFTLEEKRAQAKRVREQCQKPKKKS
jgi:hypothetical protein